MMVKRVLLLELDTLINKYLLLVHVFSLYAECH